MNKPRIQHHCLLNRFLLSFASLLSFSLEIGFAHEGPDPLAHWSFTSRSVVDGKVKARIGPDGVINGRTRLLSDDFGESLEFTGWKSDCVIADDIANLRDALPTEAITVSAWVTIDERQPWGGIVGAFQDNGYAESGILLGYNEKTFYFALASEGADDGDGLLTYLRGETIYELGKWYHVVGTYDGERMRLYVNGKLEAESTDQSEGILYPDSAPFVIGAYRDRNENFLHRGRVREVSIYDLAAKSTWVAQEFDHQKSLTALSVTSAASTQKFVVRPYLQFGTQTSMTVMWQTSLPGSSIVHYGETAACEQQIEVNENRLLHEIQITGLKPETLHFYRVEDGPG